MSSSSTEFLVGIALFVSFNFFCISADVYHSTNFFAASLFLENFVTPSASGRAIVTSDFPSFPGVRIGVICPTTLHSSGFVLLDTKEVGPVKKLALPPVRRL